MAALTRHAFLGCALLRQSSVVGTAMQERGIAIKLKHKKRPCQKPQKKATIESIMSSMQTKGFLRPYNPYQPPKDASERLDKICESLGLSTNDDTVVDDLLMRFKLFGTCANEFQYCIPNSQLAHIETIGHLRQFYQTPVFTTTPYDALQNLDLPPNLHVQKDYHRFHPDTDKMFGGKTAFPQNATIVTGLKYKDKYKGHKPEKSWPEKVYSIFD
ncbi:uncharacterized protein LOC131665213 isoform X2 [Phymastichus coffea]|uniref:uncharacterized protein LOC131665213 isoform X2 n=1 Tax=Phymastichus coffea TaxID=108790 RepID=UPI00273B1294|nr:uncharacterized protein LOC131665213 isoform X2 [Phymastichus coffea]